MKSRPPLTLTVCSLRIGYFHSLFGLVTALADLGLSFIYFTGYSIASVLIVSAGISFLIVGASFGVVVLLSASDERDSFLNAY